MERSKLSTGRKVQGVFANMNSILLHLILSAGKDKHIGVIASCL